MKKILISDATLCEKNGAYNFKEKLEIVRQLDRLNVDIIELPMVADEKADTLFIRTASSIVKKATVSVGANSIDSIQKAITALDCAKNKRLRIELPVSTVGMEYVCHKKASKMLDFIKELVESAKGDIDIEFCALDATRAEDDILYKSFVLAKECGAKYFSVSDDACEIFPEDFAKFCGEIVSKTGVDLAVYADNKNGLALAKAISAISNGATGIKTSPSGISIEKFADIIKNCGDKYGFSTGLKYTEIHKNFMQIKRAFESEKDGKMTLYSSEGDKGIVLAMDDDIKAVKSAVKKIGYDLDEEDYAKVFEEFKRVAEKKDVGSKELDAIVASVALQVPATYKLISYIINNGNIISASAQIKLSKDGKELNGICIGDGPIDAAFHAIEQIVGHHFELDDFQIQSVTEGKEAMGSALVKLRANGKLYSGNGISTDIIGAAIRAYISAINKIVYEEN